MTNRSHSPSVDDVTSAVVTAFKRAMSDDTDTPVPLSVVVALTEAIQTSKGAPARPPPRPPFGPLHHAPFSRLFSSLCFLYPSLTVVAETVLHLNKDLKAAIEALVKVNDSVRHLLYFQESQLHYLH